jgi:hypothetical protein
MTRREIGNALVNDSGYADSDLDPLWTVWPKSREASSKQSAMH